MSVMLRLARTMNSFKAFHQAKSKPIAIPISGKSIGAHRRWIISLFAFLAPVVALAQIQYQSVEDTYTQDFNSLPYSGANFTWQDNLTLPGWYAANSGTVQFNPALISIGSSTTGAFYSFGSSNSVDRALGSVGSGSSSAGGFFWGMQLVNNTGQVITSFRVSYTGEQWRSSAAAAQTVSFQYSLTASNVKTGSYVTVPELQFTSPVTGGTAGALNGNTARTIIGPFTVTGIQWSPGSSLWLRWSDPDHSGTDHGLAIDDVAFLAGSGSTSYDPPPGYYSQAEGLSGESLSAALKGIISPHTVVSYNDAWIALRLLDEASSDSTRIKLLYTPTTPLKTENGTGWGIEYLWPQSRGISSSGADYTDLFNLRASNPSILSARGSRFFDFGDPYSSGYQSPAHALAASDTSADSDSWEPRPDERGDIARALFYMDVRYDGTETNTTDLMLKDLIGTTSDMAVLATLYRWHQDDPVSPDEQRRNQLIYTQFQGNRNPFVDRPEFVYAVYQDLLQNAEDQDMDGLPTAWELQHQFNPQDPSDGDTDADGDGFTNYEEYWMGTNPRNAAEPAVIHVDANYTGSVENGSNSQPFKKIQSAINVVPAAELHAILVRPGLYNERPFVNGKASIHLMSTDGAAATIIDGQHVDSSVVRFYDFQKATFRGFTVRNAQTSWVGAGLRVESVTGSILIADNYICNNVSTNTSSSGGGGGVYLKSGDGSRLLNNYIVNNSSRRGGGVLFGAGRAEFWHNTVSGNIATAGFGGALSALQGIKPDVRNNILWGNLGTGAYTQIHQVELRDNLIEGAASGSGNINSDPLFLDVSQGNYRIGANSPARNAAFNLPVISDFDGERRPESINAAKDMGADEYTPPFDPNGDIDGDGLPDGWEIQFFGHMNYGANDDPDGDGVDNITELRRGRNPNAGVIAGQTGLKLFTFLQ